MMDILIDRISEMSLYGSIAILFVLLFRFMFKKMPKRITCLFWSVAALRLLCPVNAGTRFGIMNLFSSKQETVPATISGNVPHTSEIANQAVENITSVNDHAVISHHTAEKISNAAVSLDPKTFMFAVWLVVCVALLILFIVQGLRLRAALKGSKANSDGSYETKASSTAFVSGLIVPKIYIPETMSEDERRYVLLHEKTHIKYHDHLTKIIGLIAVCIHWFNPLVWLAYILFSRDLEMRVDETVINELGEDMKKEYCMSLVRHAKAPVIYKVLNTAFAGKSFGETEVKMRIKNLIGNKNSNKKACALALITAIGATALFSSCSDTEQVATPDAATTAVSETKVSETEESGAEDTAAEISEQTSVYDMVSLLGPSGLDEGTWESLAPQAVISAEDIADDDLRALAEEYEANGQTIYDLDTISSELDGFPIDNGFITSEEVDGNNVISVVYKAESSENVLFFTTQIADNASEHYNQSVTINFNVEGDPHSAPSVVIANDTDDPRVSSTYNDETGICILTLS